MRRLSRKAIAEVIAFDRAARTGGRFDERRYGSVTDVASIPEQKGMNFGLSNIRGGWGMPCHMAYALSPSVANCRERGKSGMPTRKTLRYNYIDVLPAGKDGKRDVEVVHVAVRLDRSYSPVVKEVVRISLKNETISYRDLRYNGLGGYVVYWNRSDYETKAVRSWFCPNSIGEWVTEKFGRSGAMMFPWHETVNPSALEGTRYRYCQYEKGHRIGLVEWLRLYRSEPRVESLAKMGLHVMISKAALDALKDRRVFDWVRAHADEVRGAYNVREVLWAARHDSDVKAARRHFEFVTELGRRMVMDGIRLDYARLERLVEKWGIQAWEYARYLQECVRAKMDVRNDGTLYPPTSGGREKFMERLERLEREGDRIERNERRRRMRAERILAEEEVRREAKEFAELMKTRIPEIAAFQRGADRVLEMSGENFRLILAKTQEELIDEGRRMGNCVGCGRYGRGIVHGQTLIVMVRDSSGRSFCDIEIDRRTWQVSQCYARHNKQAPEAVHRLAGALALKFKEMHAKKRRNAS